MSKAKEAWLKLNRAVNVSYYIGEPAWAELNNAIVGEEVPDCNVPETIGLDVDGDGQVDAEYEKVD